MPEHYRRLMVKASGQFQGVAKAKLAKISFQDYNCTVNMSEVSSCFGMLPNGGFATAAMLRPASAVVILNGLPGVSPEFGQSLDLTSRRHRPGSSDRHETGVESSVILGGGVVNVEVGADTVGSI
ncbi:hypothetical protein Bpfe_009263 [Biomphalaria pfeifferi]|uniref:Uncharacterized protein n=1 Tax=Biomphalaria pfeifferi TaxID=112525 RepID=A0AAD8FDZ4_BIOPF|nr:hypothetical protein Bpfe_009263 [Biomphalaria pfeifferi]